MKYLQEIIAFGSAPLVAWVNSWFNLFSQTGLAHPHWQEKADNLAVGISAVLALVLVAGLHHLSRKANGIITIVLALIFLLGVGVIIWARSETDAATIPTTIENWKEWWHHIYVGDLVFMTLTVLAAIFWLLRKEDEKEPGSQTE